MELPVEIYQDLKSNLPALEEALKNGVSYGGDLADRFIMYDIAQNILILLLPAVLSSILFCFCIKFYKKLMDNEMISTFVLGLLFCFVIWFFLAAITTAPVILKDLYVPEIRIIEVVGELLNSNQ